MSMNNILSKFFKNIEEHIFLNESIYRSIIVVNSYIECKISCDILNAQDYSTLVVNEINTNIDYNKIDYRILIMTCDVFKDFARYLFHNNDEYNSYNFIGISYTIPSGVVEDLKQFYLVTSKNNMNNTIIFDKKYSELLYLMEKF